MKKKKKSLQSPWGVRVIHPSTACNTIQILSLLHTVYADIPKERKKKYSREQTLIFFFIENRDQKKLIKMFFYLFSNVILIAPVS